MKRKIKQDYTRWVFVLPALIVVAVLLIYPIFSSIFYSMTTKHLIKPDYDFIGLKNYISVLSDPSFYNAFLNSILWTAASLIGQILVGFTVALAITELNMQKESIKSC